VSASASYGRARPRSTSRRTAPTLSKLPVPATCSTGVFAARLAAGDPLEKAVRTAHVAAALSVTAPGARAVQLQDRVPRSVG
jgi:hypothetical protein